MRIVVIGAGPTGLGVAYRLHQLRNSDVEVAKNVELIILEKVSDTEESFQIIMRKLNNIWNYILPSILTIFCEQKRQFTSNAWANLVLVKKYC